MTIRNYVPGDLPALHRFLSTGSRFANWRGVMDAAARVPLEDLQLAFEHPAFDPEGCFLALEGDTLVGFAVGTVAGKQGRLSSLQAAPGAEWAAGEPLYAKLEEYWQARGCTTAATIGLLYVADQFRLVEDWQFIDILRTRGWRLEWESANMVLDLQAFSLAPELEAHRRQLAAEGLEVRPMRAEETEQCGEFCARHFPAYPYVHNAARDGGPDIVEIARQGEEIVGLSTFFGFTLSHEMPEFGPILIAPDHRGKRLGKLLLCRSHEQLKQRGYRLCRLSCYSSKYRLYSSIGYEFRERFYQVMVKELGGA